MPRTASRRQIHNPDPSVLMMSAQLLAIFAFVGFGGLMVYFLLEYTGGMEFESTSDAILVGVPLILILILLALTVPIALIKSLAGFSRAIKHDDSHIDFARFADPAPRMKPQKRKRR